MVFCLGVASQNLLCIIKTESFSVLSLTIFKNKAAIFKIWLKILFAPIYCNNCDKQFSGSLIKETAKPRKSKAGAISEKVFAKAEPKINGWFSINSASRT